MYTICKGELQASYMMHGILWKEMDFYFVVGCKMDKFRKEIPGLLEVNAVYLDNLESVPCSGMLPIALVDTKIKQTKKQKNPFNLTQTMLFLLRDAFKRKEGIIQEKDGLNCVLGLPTPSLATPSTK